MEFAIVCLLSLVALGVVAAVVSAFTKGGTDVAPTEGGDCSSCSAVADGSCKIGCLMAEKQKQAKHE